MTKEAGEQYTATQVFVKVNYNVHEDPQATFFCDQHDFLVATDALFSKGD